MDTNPILTADYVLRQIYTWNMPNVLHFDHFVLHYMRREARLRIEEHCPFVMSTTGLLMRLPADMRRAVLMPMCCRIVEIPGVDRKYLAKLIADVPEFARFLQYFEAVALQRGAQPGVMDGMDIISAITCVSIILEQDYSMCELVPQWEKQIGYSAS